MSLLRASLAVLLLSLPAGAQEVLPAPIQTPAPPGPGIVLTSSDPVIQIDSGFRGQTLTLFGNIETAGLAVQPDGSVSRPYGVVVLVQGPASQREVREKGRRLGMVLNIDSALYRGLPGYYAILSSAPLADLLSPQVLAQPRMSLPGEAAIARERGDGEIFDPQLVRLMTNEGLWLERERAVTFLSPTAFAVRVPLTSHVPNGAFLAKVLAVAEGEVVAEGTALFTVRTTGTERFIATSANRHPLLYGLAAVLVALVTGWLGGVLFRR